MSPLCAQSPLLRAPVHHVADHHRLDDPLRVMGRPRADHLPHSAEGGREVHQLRGLRIHRSSCTGCPSWHGP
eukprot:15439430-Alexandrium_andersonii.AAC.1